MLSLNGCGTRSNHCLSVMNLFGAYLGIDDFSIWLRSVTLSVHRDLNEDGRPVPDADVSELTFMFDSTDNPLILDWIETPDRRHSGSITYVDSSGSVMRVAHFTNAFCLSFEEDFNSRPGASPFITTLTVSAETISFGQSTHFDHWPPLAFN